MWNNLKSRKSAFYQVYVTCDRNKDVGIFLKANKAKYGSRSRMVQQALLQKLERDRPLLSRNRAIDPLHLAQGLADRRVSEKRIARRSVRWCLMLDNAVDIQVRDFLNQYGARHGALCRYIDDAVIELIDPSKRRRTAALHSDPIRIPKNMPMPLQTPAFNNFGVGHHT